MKSLALLLLLPIALATAACNADGGTAGGPSISIDTYYARIAVQGCQRSFDCCTGAEMDAILARNWQQSVPSRQGCDNAALPTKIQEDFAAHESGIADGSMAFHGEHAQACLDAMNAVSCEHFFNDRDDHAPDACKKVFEGRLSLGATCDLSDQCPSGAVCIGNPTRGYACKKIPAKGEACTGYCPMGLFCDLDSAHPTCLPRKAQGERCELGLNDCIGSCDYPEKTCGEPLTRACIGR